MDETTGMLAVLPDASDTVMVVLPAPTVTTVNDPDDDDDGCTVAIAVLPLAAVNAPV